LRNNSGTLAIFAPIRRASSLLSSLSSNLTTGNFQWHRFAIQSQNKPIAVAQAQFSVATSGTNEE
jgi:hypothetical protein